MEAFRNVTETLARPIPGSLGNREAPRFSRQVRADYPEQRDAPHQRATELADCIREIAGAEGGASETELRREGFTMAEIVEHLPAVRQILAERYVRNIAPEGDRVPQIIDKALAAAVHRMPATAGHVPAADDDGLWRRYCAARAAFKLDPWWSQGERCLSLLGTFLRTLPLLDREANRVVYAVAAAQKADIHRIGTAGARQ